MRNDSKEHALIVVLLPNFQKAKIVLNKLVDAETGDFLLHNEKRHSLII